MPTAHCLFDKKRLRAHRARASANISAHDFLLREMAERTVERLDYIARSFDTVLDLGAHHGVLAELLKAETLVQMELSEPLLRKASGLRVLGDEEFLPFADNSFDAVISVGSLHWVNDVPGTLAQIRRILKPDGLFLCTIPGGRSLQELRESFEKAEMETRGGVSPRVSPFIDVQAAGGLLQRAGFALPVVDSDMLNVEYDHPLNLMKELRGMGESNALNESAKHLTGCSTMMMAVDHYFRNFSNEAGRINASFELVTMTGWKPHASQQRPAKRGSGTVHLGEALR